MVETKIQLSADELALVLNPEWILTKNRIIEKVALMFSRLSAQMQAEVSSRHPPAASHFIKAPKISRGEKYGGLPYVMLDYPRVFEKAHILAIRTFFWWGNFCSITLHVRGRYLAQVAQNIMRPDACSRSLYISTTGDEWNHDINSPFYGALAEKDAVLLEEELAAAGFVKVSAKVDFSHWNEMEELLLRRYAVLLQLAGL